jgi:hypothetical protein
VEHGPGSPLGRFLYDQPRILNHHLSFLGLGTATFGEKRSLGYHYKFGKRSRLPHRLHQGRSCTPSILLSTCDDSLQTIPLLEAFPGRSEACRKNNDPHKNQQIDQNNPSFHIPYSLLMPTSLRKSNKTGNIHAGLNAYLVLGTEAIQEKILYQEKLGVS